MAEYSAPKGADQNQTITCQECNNGICTVGCMETHIGRFPCHTENCPLNSLPYRVDPFEGIMYRRDAVPAPAPDNDLNGGSDHGPSRRSRDHGGDGNKARPSTSCRESSTRRDDDYGSQVPPSTKYRGSSTRHDDGYYGSQAPPSNYYRGSSTRYYDDGYGSYAPSSTSYGKSSTHRDDGYGNQAPPSKSYRAKSSTRSGENRSGHESQHHPSTSYKRSSSRRNTFGNDSCRPDPFDMRSFMASPLVDTDRMRERTTRETGDNPSGSSGQHVIYTRTFDPYSSSGNGPAPPRSRRRRQSRARAADGYCGQDSGYEYVRVEVLDGEFIGGYSGDLRSSRRSRR